MTTKDLIIRELEFLPEPALVEVLEFVWTVGAKYPPDQVRPEVWAAYLASELKRDEVYRRLADS